MFVRRAAIVAAATGLLLVLPVVPPVWAQPTPVTPVVHRTPLVGVDAGALAATPPALDPQGVAAADQGAATAVGRVAGTRRPAVFTGELPVGRFTAAGVTWSAVGAPADIVVQVRIRERGSWSDWQSLGTDDGPDGGSVDLAHAGTRRGTAPIASASADAIQVRVDTSSSSAPGQLTLVTVDAGTSPADANPTSAPSSSAHGTPARPTIITRAQWGADENLRGCDAGYSSSIKVGVVHHTVNSNAYNPSDSAALVRGIYAYHVQGNGWCDVGYQFLVDKYGQVFEGRAGGIDRPVIGAHAGGFNIGTFGVAGIGTFDTTNPVAPMMDSIVRVMGWKLGMHGVDPNGSTYLISAGGPYTQWPAGTPVNLRNISGHRDVDATGCPGNLLYPQVNNVRGSAAVYVAQNDVRKTVPSVLNPGASVVSPNGQWRTTMRVDGNLVVTNSTGGVTWQSNTFVPYSWLAVQSDGNLVIYESLDGTPLWTSNSWGPGGSRLDMQDDGNLVLYTSAGAVRWDAKGNSGHTAVSLRPWKVAVTQLGPDQRATSTDGRFFLIMQLDGNLVLYRSAGGVLWASNTGIPGSWLSMQGDGNLVMYTRDNRPVWSSDIRNPGAYTVLQNDGNVVEYDTVGNALWDSGGHTGHTGRKWL